MGILQEGVARDASNSVGQPTVYTLLLESPNDHRLYAHSRTDIVCRVAGNYRDFGQSWTLSTYSDLKQAV